MGLPSAGRRTWLGARSDADCSALASTGLIAKPENLAFSRHSISPKKTVLTIVRSGRPIENSSSMTHCTNFSVTSGQADSIAALASASNRLVGDDVHFDFDVNHHARLDRRACRAVRAEAFHVDAVETPEVARVVEPDADLADVAERAPASARTCSSRLKI